jgi:hypothetical protein
MQLWKDAAYNRRELGGSWRCDAYMDASTQPAIATTHSECLQYCPFSRYISSLCRILHPQYQDACYTRNRGSPRECLDIVESHLQRRLAVGVHV